jgi:aspartokinase
LPNEILINNTANKKLETSLITADTITRNNITVRKIDTDSIVNIFQTASVNPEGFYVIVGAFKQFDNALKKQKTNPTDYSCYIIEDKSYLSKVGLFISENDKQAAFQALKKAKMMQQDSWLLYNHKK